MNLQFDEQLAQFQSELLQTKTEIQLRTVYARYAGKEGVIRLLLTEALKVTPGPEKKNVGQMGNAALKQAEEAFQSRLASIAQENRAADLSRQLDVTLPGRVHGLGGLHPITMVRRRVERIFQDIGFSIANERQIETDFYNFEALAMPQNHPARSMQDTFYFPDENWLLRTHTSSVQIHTMLKQKPPVRIIAPGKVFRKEDDPTHSPMFTQLEGLVVDRDIHFAHLKGTLQYFVQRFFGSDTQIRLRSSFFPFTEPSAELDISCFFCKGQGGTCRTCKGTGFIEVLGCGLVDPEVFYQIDKKQAEQQGIPMEKLKEEEKYQNYTGFAFGMGLDRLAMMQYGVNDLKLFFSGDERFTQQFR